MRRHISAFLLSLALSVASLTVAGYVLAAVAFNPARPAQTVAAMLDTPQGKKLVADALTVQIQAHVPKMKAGESRQIAEKVSNDPALAGKISQLTKGNDAKAVTGVTSAVVDTIAKDHPQVAAKLRATLPKSDAGPGQLLPAQVTSQVSSVRESVTRATDIGRVAAPALALIALVLSVNRQRTLRRIARWALLVAGAQLLLWWVLPTWVLPRLDGDWPVVIGAGLRAGGGPLVAIFLVVAGIGVVAFAGSLLARYLSPVSHDRDVPEAVRRAAAKRAKDRLVSQVHVDAGPRWDDARPGSGRR